MCGTSSRDVANLAFPIHIFSVKIMIMVVMMIVIMRMIMIVMMIMIIIGVTLRFRHCSLNRKAYFDVVLGNTRCPESLSNCCAYGLSAEPGYDAPTGL